MIKKWGLASASTSLLLLAVAGSSVAEEGGRPPLSPGQMVVYNLGQAGLMTELNSYEDFGTVQSRIGQSRAQIETFYATGVTTGYEDDANVGVLPLDFFYELPGDGGTSFLKLGGLANFNRGKENQTYSYSRTGRLELEYFRAPSNDTLFGVGAIVEKTNVDLLHNDGTIEDLGYGIRADFVQKINENWGVAARAEYLWVGGETRIPLGGGGEYGFDQDWGRLYTQAHLVGTFTSETWSVIPDGWVFRPTFGALYQNNRFNDVRDTFGGVVNGTVGESDSYALLSVSGRLESTDLRPGNLAPFFEIGLDHEVHNDLNLIVDDPTILHTAVGATVNVGGGAMLNIVYARNDGLQGERRDHALTLHLGVLF